MTEKKIKKSIALSQSVIDLIENFAALNKVSFSAAAENLFLTAFQNMDTIKEIQEIQKADHAKLRREIKSNNERVITFLEELMRQGSITNAYSKIPVVADSAFIQRMKSDRDFRDSEEGRMIKKAFQTFRNRKEKSEEEFYEEV